LFILFKTLKTTVNEKIKSIGLINIAEIDFVKTSSVYKKCLKQLSFFNLIIYSTKGAFRLKPNHTGAVSLKINEKILCSHQTV